MSSGQHKPDPMLLDAFLFLFVLFWYLCLIGFLFVNFYFVVVVDALREREYEVGWAGG